MSTEHPVSRRRFATTASAGLALPVLAACGSGDTGTATRLVVVGSGVVELPRPAAPLLRQHLRHPGRRVRGFEADKVVVTQPTEGDFKAFSSHLHPPGVRGERVHATARSPATATAAASPWRTAP